VPAGKTCGCYSKFAVYTLLNHGGDFRAAARALADQGYGAQGSSTRQQGAPATSTTRRPAAAIILAHMTDIYRPAFRRGDRLWSAALRAEVRRSEVLARCADSAVMEALADDASEMPRDDDGGARRGAPPRVYREWAPVAWADLLCATTEEPETAEIDPGAEEDFRRRLAGALTRIVTLSCHNGADDEEDHREARSILHWCLQFARPGAWASVRSYYVWCRMQEDGGDRHNSLRVAIRPELLGQLGLRELEALGQYQLTQLAERYGVGCRCRAGRGGQRAIALDPDYVRGLLEGPGPEEDEGDN
jgi:hypothetical protein